MVIINTINRLKYLTVKRMITLVNMQAGKTISKINVEGRIELYF